VSSVTVSVLSDKSAPSYVLSLLPTFGAASALKPEEERRLGAVVESLVRFTLDNAYPNDELGEIEVTLEADEGFVRVVVHDWGLPLTSAGGDFGPLPEPLAALASEARSLQLVNLGSEGKRLTAEVAVSSSGDGHVARHHVADAPRRGRTGAGAPTAIEVRTGTAKDAEAIARLLYENYHLSYVHGDFYRPRYLMAELASGRLVSTVAVHEGRVIGHHALMPLPGVPSAETGAAVVNSTFRGLGVFGRMFEHTLDAARERGLAAVFGDAVTIHPFSQRVEFSHGYRESALQLGMVPAQTSMRGFGRGGPERRTATLRSYRPLAEYARPAALPACYREMLESAYENLGLSVEGHAEPVPLEGEAVTANLDGGRALGAVRLRHWNDDARAELERAVRHLLSQHVDVIYADVDLAAVGELDDAVAELNRLGFFAAGLVLHGPDGHDHLRLQLLDSEEIELENIVCDSPYGESLRRQVLEDKTRVIG
jgi:N-acetylglutamate synthase-like GNAT family acetyltransferase